MEPTKLRDGDVIDYRGAPATVSECWTRIEDAPTSFRAVEGIEPVVAEDGAVLVAGRAAKAGVSIGCTIEWPENGEMKTCRLLWKMMPVDPADPDGPQALIADGLNGPLKLYGD